MNFGDIKEKIYAIPGLLILGQEKWLFETAKSLPDDAVVLEIGGYLGRSTCCLAFGCVGTKRHVFTIDIFDTTVDSEIARLHIGSEKFYEVWRGNIKRNELLEYVTPLIGLSKDVAKTWMKPINFLFIDGSHEYGEVLADFNNFYPHVVPGGLVGLHDVEEGHPDVVKVWNQHVKRKLVETGDYINLAFGKKPKEANK